MEIEYSKQFKRDIKKLNLDNQTKNIISYVLNKLINNLELDQKYNNHKLKGNLKSLMELHVKPDLLMIYKLDKVNNVIKLIRLGSHSELYK